MGKQMVNFINCSCESSAPFFVIYKPGMNQRRIGDELLGNPYELLGNPTTRAFVFIEVSVIIFVQFQQQTQPPTLL